MFVLWSANSALIPSYYHRYKTSKRTWQRIFNFYGRRPLDLRHSARAISYFVLLTYITKRSQRKINAYERCRIYHIHVSISGSGIGTRLKLFPVYYKSPIYGPCPLFYICLGDNKKSLKNGERLNATGSWDSVPRTNGLHELHRRLRNNGAFTQSATARASSLTVRSAATCQKSTHIHKFSRHLSANMWTAN